MRLYFARRGGVNLSAATMLVVGGHVWYSYGASDNIGREFRPSNAMQWRMLRDSYALGATVYDLRGISDSLDETNHLFGLIQFKVGAGGRQPSTSASGTSRSTSCSTRRSTSTCHAADPVRVAPLSRPGARAEPPIRPGVAPSVRRIRHNFPTSDSPQPRERFRDRPWRSRSTSTPRAGGHTTSRCPSSFRGSYPRLQGQRLRLRPRAARRRGHPPRLGHPGRRHHVRGHPDQGLVRRRSAGPDAVQAGRGARTAARPCHPLGVVHRRRVRPRGHPCRHRGDVLDETARCQRAGSAAPALRHRERPAGGLRHPPAAGPHRRLGRRRGGHRLDRPSARGTTAAAHDVRQPPQGR